MSPGRGLGLVTGLIVAACARQVSAAGSGLVGAGLGLETVVHVDAVVGEKVRLSGACRRCDAVSVLWRAPGGDTFEDVVGAGLPPADLAVTEAGAWEITFPGAAEGGRLDPFELEVFGADGEPRPGRAWSNLWTFDSGSYTRRASVDLFALAQAGEGQTVVQVELSGLAGFWWQAGANGNGVSRSVGGRSIPAPEGGLRGTVPLYLEAPVPTGSEDPLAVDVVEVTRTAEGAIVMGVAASRDAEATIGCGDLRRTFDIGPEPRKITLEAPTPACSEVAIVAGSKRLDFVAFDIEAVTPGIGLLRRTRDGVEALPLGWDDTLLATDTGSLDGPALALPIDGHTRHGWKGDELGGGPGNNAFVDTYTYVDAVVLHVPVTALPPPVVPDSPVDLDRPPPVPPEEVVVESPIEAPIVPPVETPAPGPAAEVPESAPRVPLLGTACTTSSPGGLGALVLLLAGTLRRRRVGAVLLALAVPVGAKAQAFGQDIVTQVRVTGSPLSLVRLAPEQALVDATVGTALLPVVAGDATRPIVARLDVAQIGATALLGGGTSLRLGLPAWRSAAGASAAGGSGVVASVGDLAASVSHPLHLGRGWRVDGVLGFVWPVGGGATALGAAAPSLEPAAALSAQFLDSGLTGASLALRLDRTGARHVELAAGVRAGRDLFGSLQVLARAPLGGWPTADRTPVEALASGGYRFGPFTLEASIGTGLVGGLGASQLRAGVSFGVTLDALPPSRAGSAAGTPSEVPSARAGDIVQLLPPPVPFELPEPLPEGEVLLCTTDAGGLPVAATWRDAAGATAVDGCVALRGDLSGTLSAPGRAAVPIQWRQGQRFELSIELPPEAQRWLVVRDTVAFAPGEDRLAPGSDAVLRDFVSHVSPHERTSGRVLVSGHADQRGSDLANDALSDRRANAVAQALRALGVGCDITTEALGRRRPRSDAFDASSLTANRRVELEWVLSTDVEPVPTPTTALSRAASPGVSR